MPEVAETKATEIRVLAVSHYFATNGYGIESIAARINQLLRARGYSVRWLAATAENRVTRSLPSGEYEVGIPSWDGIREATDLGWPLFGPWQLPRIVREVRKADVVHLHEAFFPLNQAVLWIAVLLRRPIVITQHIADMPIAGVLRGNLVRLANLVMTRPAFACADRVVYYSRRTQAHFAQLSRGKDVFVANGCDAELFHPVAHEEAAALRRELALPSDGVLALFVGRFIEKKGLHLLRKLVAAHPSVHFVFVGNGPLDPSAWNLPNVVVRAPVSQPELRRYYQASDMLILPAVGEGFPSRRPGGVLLRRAARRFEGDPRRLPRACSRSPTMRARAAGDSPPLSPRCSHSRNLATARSNVRRSPETSGHGSNAVTLTPRSSARSSLRAMRVKYQRLVGAWQERDDEARGDRTEGTLLDALRHA